MQTNSPINEGLFPLLRWKNIAILMLGLLCFACGGGSGGSSDSLSGGEGNFSGPGPVVLEPQPGVPTIWPLSAYTYETPVGMLVSVNLYLDPACMVTSEADEEFGTFIPPMTRTDHGTLFYFRKWIFYPDELGNIPDVKLHCPDKIYRFEFHEGILELDPAMGTSDRSSVKYLFIDDESAAIVAENPQNCFVLLNYLDVQNGQHGPIVKTVSLFLFNFFKEIQPWEDSPIRSGYDMMEYEYFPPTSTTLVCQTSHNYIFVRELAVLLRGASK